MVAGGVYGDAAITKSHYEEKHVVRSNQEMFDQTPGLNWQKLGVNTFDPENNAITLSDGSKVTYDYLVVSPGL